MQSKINYPWEFAPPGFEWAAIDENNNAYWFREAPVMSKTIWQTLSGKYEDEVGPCFIQLGVYNAPAGFDWQTSLQKRPDGQTAMDFQIEMVPVEGGTFLLGGKVIVTLPSFEIGKYPITQKQWVEIMGNNPSYFIGDNLPVETVDWYDVQQFIKKLNAKHPGKNYRLPTEAEWEYAARGGRLSKGYKYAGSNDLKEVGWYCDNSNSRIHPVGQLKPNELGLFDMSGNVWEYCQEWPMDYPESRVLRGGSWINNDNYCRSAFRVRLIPDYRVRYSGFRVSRHL